MWQKLLPTYIECKYRVASLLFKSPGGDLLIALAAHKWFTARAANFHLTRAWNRERGLSYLSLSLSRVYRICVRRRHFLPTSYIYTLWDTAGLTSSLNSHGTLRSTRRRRRRWYFGNRRRKRQARVTFPPPFIMPACTWWKARGLESFLSFFFFYWKIK